MKKKYIFLFALVFVVGGAIGVTFVAPVKLLTGALFTWRSDEAGERLKDIYDVKFKLSNVPIGNLNTYLPKYKTVDIDGAIHYFLLFGMNASESSVVDAIEETEQYFSCSGEEGTLYVNKYSNLINYVAKRRANTEKAVAITEEQALKKAEDFIDARFLFLSYEEAEITFDGEFYHIRFINRIGNIKNHAFVTSVTVDESGEIVSMAYYHMNYERLASVKIISMEDATARLPIDLPIGEQVELNKCSLSYVYENSVVQPAYLFEGVTSGGDTFQCFINAASYN